jgi:hypothetical protein
VVSCEAFVGEASDALDALVGLRAVSDQIAEAPYLVEVGRVFENGL